MKFNHNWIYLTALLLLSSCASVTPSPEQPQQAGGQVDPHLQLQEQLPPIPGGKSSAAIFTTEVNGQDTFARSANAIDSDTALDLISGTTDISWGIWQFFYPANLKSVQAVISVPDGQAVYLALADYQTGSWDFDGPLSAGKSLPLDEQAHRSPDGYFYIAAITFGGDTATVHKHVLTTESDWRIDPVVDERVSEFSLALLSSRPGICYKSGETANLKFVRSEDFIGSAWGTPAELPAGEFDQFRGPSLAFVDTRPSVSVGWEPGGGNSRIGYIRAQDYEGTMWNEPQSAGDPVTGYVIEQTVMRVVADKPLIAYSSNAEVGSVRASDSSGSAWMDPVQVYDGDAEDLALGLDGSTPILSFVDTGITFDYILFSRSENAKGDSWELPATVKQVQTFGPQWTTAATVENHWRIAFFDGSGNDIRIAHWNSSLELWQDDAVLTGDKNDAYWYLSMAVVGGNPAISYYSFDEAALKYIRANDPAGTDWGDPVTVDHYANTGGQTQLINLGGVPGIAYLAGAELRFAYLVGE
jgi:hypothetical protein